MTGYVCSECGSTNAGHWDCPDCGRDDGHTLDRLCRKCGRDHRTED